MIKLTFILIGLFIIIHFILYYWNIDPFHIYNSKKTIIEEIKIEKEPCYDFSEVKDNLEDCLNELKQYNSNNINNESLESLD